MRLALNDISWNLLAFSKRVHDHALEVFEFAWLRSSNFESLEEELELFSLELELFGEVRVQRFLLGLLEFVGGLAFRLEGGVDFAHLAVGVAESECGELGHRFHGFKSLVGKPFLAQSRGGGNEQNRLAHFDAMRYFEMMKRQIFGALFVIATTLSGAAAEAATPWNGRVFDVSRQAFLTDAEIHAQLAGVEILVLGEKHDTPSVQLQQARAISETLEANPAAIGRWVLGWEFLNRRDQLAINEDWSRVNADEITVSDLLDRFMGKGRGRSYSPILEAGVRFAGELRGLNLARDEKAPVVRGGLEALDPAVLPPGFAMGGAGYRERFDAVMGGGHASPDAIGRYFQAQCLTDDVMAYELLKGASPLRVLINGSFHSDYFDAAIDRIRARDQASRLLSIRFIDASDYSESELTPDLKLAEPVVDPKYGALADWIWFAGEPSSLR